ncbi:MAG: helix-turn-helix domain-containing protein [Cyanobacteria bacterium P01_F01_bin.143]
MKESVQEQNHHKLNTLLKDAGFENSQELSKATGISQWQLSRLEYGLIHRLTLDIVLQLAAALKIPLEKLITTFASEKLITTFASEDKYSEETSTDLGAENQEYQRLQKTIEQQRETLELEFQAASVQAIESWLLQWPTAVAAIDKNPELPAERLLLLVKPIEELVSNWGVEAMYAVGEELPYDPQWHELLKGDAEPGDMVQVRYVGYKQGEKILYKAKVSTFSVNS